MNMKPLLAAAAAIAFASTAHADDDSSPWQPQPYSTIQHPDWSKDAVLYQINTRQFTPEGTFAAAEKQLPRLKALGVDVLWLMPIHPIGVENRKGTLGSPYSVRDYYDVNPEFGTREDFRHFVDTAHAQGFRVILDWVANHTAWDHPLAKEHPDWYEKDWKGDFRPTPWWDWSDIIDLDWSRPGVREHVGKAMEMWVRDYGVDGFRADVAGYVPLDFWERERTRLEAIRPVFMLAEWKSSELTRKAFDAVYAWEWHHTAVSIAQGKADPTAFYGYYAENESAWPHEAMRLTYIANHDSNAWEGTQYENFGDALPAFLALSFTGEGLPMLYNGQEACNARRLAFFERDPIDWSRLETCDIGALARDLIAFRRANPALANGQWGGRMSAVLTDQPKQVFAWVREAESNRVVGLFNLSDRPVRATLSDGHAAGHYAEFRSPTPVTLEAGQAIDLPAWGFRLLSGTH
ncbi:alpha-amylase family glycosyl hydrolase [Tsuneonella sp. YG55]|uniref:Alpha-amylase family glycosyl hydrolase n=1 Tax=Tsuneonella litorea TaxID=2976475 RepID=A0A9X2W090_9SPHN|nr:alpha-amylase family glycosyl hydrolase [Tsuneonella litorea]MCT2557500.1 alpha-amylase family glycosyl hydrolase [Tsuneonella litorea]